MNNTELLPCPFCGSKDIDFGNVAIGNFVSCSRCKVEIFHSNHAMLSPRAWNTRSSKAAPVERIEGLRDALSIFEKGIPDLTDYEIVGVYLADCEKYEDRCHMVVKAARAYLKLQGGE